MTDVTPVWDGQEEFEAQVAEGLGPVDMARQVATKAEMQRLLRGGTAVKFLFYRVTYGSDRYGIGTLNQDVYPFPTPTGERTNRRPGLVVYWDIGRGGWRSFYARNVQSVQQATVAETLGF